MSNRGKVISVNIAREQDGQKIPVGEAAIDEYGLVSKARAPHGTRQVSILGQSSIDALAGELNQTIKPGACGEDLTIEGLDIASSSLLDRYVVGRAELEVTQIGNASAGDAGEEASVQQVVSTQGVLCRVVTGGMVRRGDVVRHTPKVLHCLLITLSDRAFNGVYEDRSGPRAKQLLEAFLECMPWPIAIESVLLPDDADQLRTHLTAARERGADLVITLGGTGVGPRDITPQTVEPLCDMLIPGIMEAIRIKFGTAKPHALLSRAVAGVMRRTLIFALPGSVRAVEEYLQEIFTTLEHLLYVVHGIDDH
jgi:molybdopterin adenylyltransferase